MGFLSHLVQRKKLKAPNQPDASTDDFRDVVNTDDRRLLTGRYSLDVALEDRICDLYDLYVEGMDEDKGPQSRKLYVELAELWPVGYMDNLGIKDAIYRAKKRRRHKAPDHDRIERRKPAVTAKSEEPSLPTQTQASHERPVVDSTLALAPRDKPISFLNTQLPSGMMDQIAYPIDGVQHFGYGSKLVEKGGSSTGANSDGGSKAAPVEVKRRLKRKSETDVEPHTHPMKMQAQAGKEKNSNLILQQPKPSSNNPMPSVASISDQPS
ncbi:hypothetical protein HPP92_025169 [Vanilla planifolia]|uniref:Uncharacterized protein n=1 Tax=Vanilla planifolia TaxID=51239 RepID=A0A835PHH5_VANPL|nr:hypothetical protein HPP92_025169 [Vanilla planifolia]